MKLQGKMTLTLLTVSLVTAACVGIVAYGYLMRGFQKSSENRAFENFTSDIKAYLDRYGSMENGQRQEPFPAFAVRRRLASQSTGSAQLPLENTEGGRPASGVAPFRFMILDADGSVIQGAGDYTRGQKVPGNILDRSHPIEHDGRIAVRLVQIGDAVLTEQDHRYLVFIRKALTIGIVAASVISVLLGLLIGRRQSAALRELSTAIGAISLDGEIRQEIPVRSKDEIGLLAKAFNQMSESLTRTHAELLESHNRIQTQARELKELSVRDPLTNLFNRRHFDAQAETLFNQSLRYRRPLTVMIGDLDHFKKINDRISHGTGDEVLRQVAEIIRSNTRRSDIAARYGGEEFVVAFPETPLLQAQQFCEKLRGIIEAHPWKNIHPDLAVTISMGLCDDLSIGSIEKMLNNADEQLYAAKHEGRNRVMPRVLLAS